MASYNLEFRASVAHDLRLIPKQDVGRILKRIELLTENPRPVGCEKLSSQERYRILQGNYRIICEIQDNILRVIVVKIGHRGDVDRST